ncbi:MAG: FkbM family methyltransferase [Verrucomicrobiales bacterium]
MFQRIKVFVKAAFGRELIEKTYKVSSKERFGSDYGGWDVVTADIDENTIIYSFGLGEDVSFDSALIERFDLTIHGFDPTPKSIEWVKRHGFSDRFIMHEYGVAGHDGDVDFNPPENPDHVSHTILNRPSTGLKAISLPVRRVSTIMKDLGHRHVNIIKMDVEGAEYDVIKDISNSDIRPQQILVEFHHRFPDVGIEMTKDAINRLKAMGYQLFSVSASNEDFCFIRNLL